MRYASMRCRGVHVEPQHLALQRRPRILHRDSAFRGKLLELIGGQRGDQVHLAAPEAQQFQLAVLLDFQADDIQIGQPLPALSLPVVRISRQQDERAGFVFGDAESAPAPPALSTASCAERMATWSNSLATAGYSFREDHGDFVFAALYGLDGAFSSLECVASWGMQGRIQQDLHGMNYVSGGKRRAIGEEQALPQLENDGLAAVLHLPRCGKFRFELLIAAIDAHQDAAGEIAYGLGRVAVRQRGMEAPRFTADTEAQFATPLCCPSRGAQNREWNQRAHQDAQAEGRGFNPSHARQAALVCPQKPHMEYLSAETNK